jgi:hypothetical protein
MKITTMKKIIPSTPIRNEYEVLLRSGLFFEFYPELTGEWEKDEIEWNKIYKELKRLRRKSNLTK